MTRDDTLDTIDSADLPVPEPERQHILRARALGAERLAPRAASYDRENRFPRENFDDLREHGLLGLRVPSEYGGFGASELCYAGVVLEVGRADAATALCFTMHSTAMTFIGDLGSSEQKRRFFGYATAGKTFSALGSEPQSSIFSGKLPSTTLTRSAGGYRLNGKKAWCSWGGNADYMYIDATLDGAVRGMVVPMKQPSVVVHDDWDTLSVRGTDSVSIDLNDVPVSEADVMVRPPTLLHEFEFMVGLSSAYLGVALAAYGVARSAARESIARILSQEVGHGHPDAARLFTSIGEMKFALQPAWLNIQRAAQSGQVGSFDRAAKLAAAKYGAAEAAAEITAKAMRVVGAKGLSKKNAVERLFRDAQAGLVMALKPDHAAYLAGRFDLGVPPSGLRITEGANGFALSPKSF